MKTTGCRAWRQAGKRFRRKQRKFGCNPSLTVGVYTKRHWTDAPGHNGLCGDQFPPKAQQRPFTARSLVGMSQSSRKRKARAVAFVINSVTFFEHAVPLASALHERLYRERGFPRHSEEMMRVRDVRSKYRIGERLRQCPGCFHCQPGVKGWHIDRSRSGRFNMPALALHCDGIGVLPARKQK